MVIIKSFLIYILVFCFINIVASEHSNFLEYDNYSNRSVIIPNDFNEQAYLSDSIVSAKNTFVNLTKVDTLSNTYNFLCSQELIFGWYQHQSSTDSVITKDDGLVLFKNDKTSLIKEFKSSSPVVNFVGEFNISENFNSVLIVIESSDEIFPLREVYLLNYKNRKMLSITKLSELLVMDGEVYLTYTKRLRANLFLFLARNDFISESFSVEFFYDASGRLVVTSAASAF